MHTFQEWIATNGPKDDSPSDADRLITIIAGADDSGMTFQKIKQCVDLPSDLLHRLLAALVGVGQLVAAEEKGVTIFRTVPWVRDLAGHARTQERKIRSLH